MPDQPAPAPPAPPPAPAPAPSLGTPAAYRVIPADGKSGIPNIPNELYFFIPQTWTGAVPGDQESARLKLDQFGSIMKQALADDQTTLDLNFNKLLAVAQGTFNDSGFHVEPLSNLEVMKLEIVRFAGARLRDDYLKRFTKAVAGAFVIILLVSVLLDGLITFGVKCGYVDVSPIPTDTTNTTAATTGTPDPSTDGTAATPVQKDQGPDEKTSVCAPPQHFHNGIHWDGNFYIMHIGLLLAFSMWGLLFASMTRGMTLTFEDLLTPEADLISPWIRLTFYGIAIFILGTLFSQQWVTVSLGDTFSTASIHDNAIASIIFGLLLGIAERLVPQKIVQYATKLVNL